jgi:hypothetical protein
MSSISETGYANVLANFERLVSYCREIGDAYRPSNPLLALDALNGLSAECRSALEAVTAAKIKHDNAVKERATLYAGLGKFSTRLLAALEAAGAPKTRIERARALARKIRGERAKNAAMLKTENSGEQSKQHSVSRRSFDSKAEYFGQLVALISDEPAYAPNEPDISKATLAEKTQQLLDSNRAIAQTAQKLSLTRQERDKCFFAEENALRPLGQLTKTYLKSILGNDSPLYKAIGKLRL